MRVGRVEQILGQVVARVDETGREAAPDTVDDGSPLFGAAPFEGEQVDVEDVRPGGRGAHGVAGHGTDASGAPPGVNSAGQPPVWMNTTSSPAPNRPSSAAPEQTGQALAGVGPIHQPTTVARRPVDGRVAGRGRHRVVVADPSAVDLDVVGGRRSRRGPSATASRWRARRCRGSRPPRPWRRRSATTSGHAPAAAARGRPSGEQPGVGPPARRREHDRRRARDRAPSSWSRSSMNAGGVPERTRRRTPADRDRVRPQPVGGERVGDRLAGDLEFAPVMVRRTGEVELRTEQGRQQLVPRRRSARRLVARQHQVDLDAEPGAGRRRHPAVVRLRRTDGDERLGVGGHRRAAQELELACLVAPAAEPGQIVTFHPQPGAARQASHRLRAGSGGTPARPGRDAGTLRTC